MKAYIDNWRWAGIPFYIRSGKAMAERLSEITIAYRQPPLALFQHDWHEGHSEGDHTTPNTLSMRVQPNEGIRLNFGLKIPGPSMTLQPNDMEFCYSDVFKTENPEAYERLILDAILGDRTLFIRRDEVDAAWIYVDNIIQGWQEKSSIANSQLSRGKLGTEIGRGNYSQMIAGIGCRNSWYWREFLNNHSSSKSGGGKMLSPPQFFHHCRFNFTLPTIAFIFA